jgi:hypothetical protein
MSLTPQATKARNGLYDASEPASSMAASWAADPISDGELPPGQGAGGAEPGRRCRRIAFIAAAADRAAAAGVDVALRE